nr:nuclease [Rhizobium sp. TCK]
MRSLLLVIVLILFASSADAAGSEIAGPVEAEVLRVIDGDTLLVEARPWPQQKVEVYVRIRGIDTPELRSSCPSERQAGEAARRALESLTEHAALLQLSRISGDKYFGRVVADVTARRRQRSGSACPRRTRGGLRWRPESSQPLRDAVAPARPWKAEAERSRQSLDDRRKPVAGRSRDLPATASSRLRHGVSIADRHSFRRAGTGKPGWGTALEER